MNHRPNRLASILVVQLYAALHHVYPKCAFAGDSYSPGVGHVDRAIWVRRTATCHLPLTTSAGQEAQYRLKHGHLLIEFRNVLGCHGIRFPVAPGLLARGHSPRSAIVPLGHDAASAES